VNIWWKSVRPLLSSRIKRKKEKPQNDWPFCIFLLMWWYPMKIGPPKFWIVIACAHETMTIIRSLEWLSRSLKVIGNITARCSTYDFLLLFHSNYGPILYRFPHIARYWSKNIVKFIYPTFFFFFLLMWWYSMKIGPPNAPIGGTPPAFHKDV